MRSSRRYCPIFVLAAAFQLPLAAQVGPYPGQNPPGRYPYPGGGGVGLPGPRRSKQKKDTKKDNPEPLLNVEGVLRELGEESVVVEAPDTRIINAKRLQNTKFFKNGEELKPSDLKPGDHLLIEARQDEEGFLYAVNVIWQKDGTPQERAAAGEPVEISTQSSQDDEERPILRRQSAAELEAPRPPVAPAAASEPEKKPPPATSAPAASSTIEDEQGPPRLRRGKPGSRKRPEPQEKAEVQQPRSQETAGPPASDPASPGQPELVHLAQPAEPQDAAIEKAREAAGSFTETLPNYVCQELVARFVNTSHIVNWRPLDVVSAEVVYENGRERYRNLTISGKPTRKQMEELPGAWSTGEFGTVLVDILSPSTAAGFQFRKKAAIAGRPALVYDFSVELEHSHWRVQVPSQTVRPAYGGSVWIDSTSSRLLRIEMQARYLPEAFPLDKVESAVDYDYVRLGGEHLFLLPVHAETLSCQRGTNMCSRNTIDFRNYHKYTGEANIIFKQ